MTTKKFPSPLGGCDDPLKALFEATKANNVDIVLIIGDKEKYRTLLGGNVMYQLSHLFYEILLKSSEDQKRRLWEYIQKMKDKEKEKEAPQAMTSARATSSALLARALFESCKKENRNLVLAYDNKDGKNTTLIGAGMLDGQFSLIAELLWKLVEKTSVMQATELLTGLRDTIILKKIEEEK